MREEIKEDNKLYDQLKEFIQNYGSDKPLEGKYKKQIDDLKIGKRVNIEIDATDLLDFDGNLYENLVNDPDDKNGVFATLKIVIKELTEEEVPIRFIKLAETMSLRKIRSKHLGKMIEIEGIANKVSPVKNEIVIGVFRCEKCGHINIIDYSKKPFFYKPKICESLSCGRGGPFTEIEKETIKVDWQKMTLQESPEKLKPGSLPKTIDVVIRGEDLVDIVEPGERVKIVGIVRDIQEGTAKFKKKTYKKFIQCVGITVQKEEEIKLTPEDIIKIKELGKKPFIIDMLANSAFPAIKGYDFIKKAILLQSVGGVSRELPDGTKLRGDPNILILGDPGVSKTQIVLKATRLSRRGIYTSGKGVSRAGLTVAVVQDEMTGGWVLEAGAVLLARDGLLGIDEVDKMSKDDRSAMHEVMSQRTISIAKAGIVATLPAECKILACGNPKFGRFDRSKSFMEQIDLPPTLVDRFDLIFLILDVPDEKKDSELADFIGEIHMEGNFPQKVPIEDEMLRKYIDYAGTEISPKLTKKALSVIKKFWGTLRKISETESTIVITARQLDGLIRLCEAHAKLRLSNEVEEEDAEGVIEIYRDFLHTVGVDPETGKLDIDVIMTGKPKSQRDRLMKLLDIISELDKGQGTSFEEILQEGEREGMDKNFIRRAIDEYKQKGDLYEPTPNKFKVLR